MSAVPVGTRPPGEDLFQGPLPFGNCSALKKGLSDVWFEHLYVSSSLFENTVTCVILSPPPPSPTTLPPGAKDEKADPGCTLVQWTFRVPVSETPQAGGLPSFLCFV